MKDLIKQMLKDHPKCAAAWHILGCSEATPKKLRVSSVSHNGVPEYEICGLLDITDKMSMDLDEAGLYEPRDKYEPDFSDGQIERWATKQLRGEGRPGVGEVLISHEGKLIDQNKWIKAIGLSHVTQRMRVRLGVDPIEETIKGSTVPLTPWERLHMLHDHWRFVSALYRQKFKIRRPPDPGAKAWVEQNKETLDTILSYLPRVGNVNVKRKKLPDLIPAWRHESKLLVLWEALERDPEKTKIFLQCVKDGKYNYWVDKFSQISLIVSGRAQIYGRAVSIMKAYLSDSPYDTRLSNKGYWREKIASENNPKVAQVICDRSEIPVAAKALHLTTSFARMVVGWAKISGNFQEVIEKAQAMPHDELMLTLRAAKKLSNILILFSGRAATGFMLRFHEHPLIDRFLDKLHLANLRDEWRVSISDKKRSTLPALEQAGHDLPWLEKHFGEMAMRIQNYQQ